MPRLPTGNVFAPFIRVGSRASVARTERVARAIEKKINKGMMTIAGAIRRKARKSINHGGAKNRKHSRPGKPIISPKPGTIMYNTVFRYYDSKKMSLLVGFSSRGFENKDGARPTGGKSIPNLLEYGGGIYSSKPTVKLARRTEGKWVTHYWKQKKKELIIKRKRLGKTAQEMPQIKKRDIKWVVIPPGNRKVKARPTMRPAFNAVTADGKLGKHWRNIGITDPAEIEKHIF